MTKIKEVTNFLQTYAPLALQEEYDNAGLIVGDSNEDITGVLVCLDCIESVVDEAIQLKANLIVAHHPIVFKGLKKFNGSNYVERTIIKAIKNNIAIYAIHTNLDNVNNGVNKVIADRLGLQNCSILAPKPQTLKKITFFVPASHVDQVCESMYGIGAGNIGNYRNCSFKVDGKGSFMPKEMANPYSGKIGEVAVEDETRVEMMFPTYLQSKVVAAMKQHHPYEEVAYYITDLQNENQEIGAGMIGNLEKPMKTIHFFDFLKEKMELNVLKHTSFAKENISRVAVCGGSGSFLTRQAIMKQADVYITSDIKYHEFFDAESKIILVDIGHYESEKYTNELLFSLISNKFSNFALHCTKVNTNPITFY